jgi:glycopeptide antibiotics resistance protein
MKKISLSDIKKRLIDTDRVEKKYLYVLLGCYAVILIWGIVFKFNMNGELNIEENLSKSVWDRFTTDLIPFYSFYTGIFLGRTNELLAGIFNVILFIPLGALLSFLTSKKLGLLISALCMLGVEIFQLFSGFGGFDYSDVILNVLGVYFGYLIASIVVKKMSVRLINGIALSLTVPLFIFATVVFIRTIVYFPI